MGRAVVRAASRAYLGVFWPLQPTRTTWTPSVVERGRLPRLERFLATSRSVRTPNDSRWYGARAYGDGDEACLSWSVVFIPSPLKTPALQRHCPGCVPLELETDVAVGRERVHPHGALRELENAVDERRNSTDSGVLDLADRGCPEVMGEGKVEIGRGDGRCGRTGAPAAQLGFTL